MVRSTPRTRGFARGHREQPGAGTQQAGLAGTVGADHHDHLTLVERQIDPGKGWEAAGECDRGTKVNDRGHGEPHHGRGGGCQGSKRGVRRRIGSRAPAVVWGLGAVGPLSRRSARSGPLGDGARSAGQRPWCAGCSSVMSLALMVTVLMPLPAADFDPTEAAVTWQVLASAGHDVVFATPSGQRAGPTT